VRFNTVAKAAIRADGGPIKARWRDLLLGEHIALQVLLTTAWPPRSR
jgi:hypothetical protein